MYQLIYYSDFKDLNDVMNRIEIYKDLPTSIKPKSLLLNGDPIRIDYEGEDIYKPLKMSSCSINVLTNEILTELYTGKLNDIILKVYKGGSFFWMGYLTPNIYNSEYNSEFDLLTLEFIDCVALLENTKWVKSNSLISSFYSVISRLLDKIDSLKIINKIYLHSSLSVANNDDILNTLYILDRNFQDEEEEPLTNKSVLEDILTYLGMSLILYKDAFYIIDYDALTRDNYNFIVYDRTSGTSSSETVAKDVRTISEIGLYEGEGNISMGDVYNKINVRAISNPVDDIVPELFDDLTNLNADLNKYYEEIIKILDEDTCFLSSYFNSSKWLTKTPVSGSILGSTEISEVTIDNIKDIYAGSFFLKYDDYKVSDGEPSSIHWLDAITFAGGPKDDIVGEKEFKALSTSVDYVVYKRGYFIMDLEYLFNNSSHPNRTDEDADMKYTNDKFTIDFHNTMFMCRLMIGDYYFDGKVWRNWNTDYLPYKDLYENSMYGVEIKGQDKKYYYIYGGTKTYITEEEYNKMKLGDRFYLVHNNKVGDAVYNNWKHLTNLVSYKMELVNSEDGVLIQLPSFVLFGKMTLDIYAPNDLGAYANKRTKDVGTYNTWVRYCHIKNFKMIHTYNKGYKDIFNTKKFDPDTLYTNVIDEDNVKELDDIEMRVNTYTTKASSFSYVILKAGEGYNFIEKIHNKNYNEDLIMEEATIRKYVERYSLPKYIYSDSFINKDIKPYTIIRNINRNLVANDLSYDLANNSVNITSIEL